MVILSSQSKCGTGQTTTKNPAREQEPTNHSDEQQGRDNECGNLARASMQLMQRRN